MPIVGEQAHKHSSRHRTSRMQARRVLLFLSGYMSYLEPVSTKQSVSRQQQSDFGFSEPTQATVSHGTMTVLGILDGLFAS